MQVEDVAKGLAAPRKPWEEASSVPELVLTAWKTSPQRGWAFTQEGLHGERPLAPSLPSLGFGALLDGECGQLGTAFLFLAFLIWGHRRLDCEA